MKKLLLSIALCLIASFANADTIYESRIEQVTSLPITNGVTITPQQVLSTCFPVAAGKTADIRFQTEVTNPYQFNVGIGWIVRGWDYNVVGSSSTFIRSFDITPAVMQNVTPAGHHMVIENSYLHKVDFTSGGNTRCYTVNLWAVSSNGSGNITVEQGYSYIQTSIRD